MGSEKSRKGWFERMLPHIPYCGADEEVWITGKALQAIADVSEHQRSAGINWGRGNYTPSPLQRERLAAALGVPIDEIAWEHAVPVHHLRGNGPQCGRST